MLSRRLISAFAVLAASAGALAAQDNAIFLENQLFDITPAFFAALVAGLLIALGFQLLLTNLSLAAGVTAIGPIKRGGGGGGTSSEGSTLDHVFGSIKKINHAYGAWATITAGLALFFASWLAVELSNVELQTDPFGSMLAICLGIWALFLIVTVSLEVSAVTSLFGSIARIATGSLRSIGSAASGIFGKSAEKQAGDIAERITTEVKKEFFGGADNGQLKERLESYIERLSPEPLDYKALRRELGKLIDRTETEALSITDEDGEEHLVLRRNVEDGPGDQQRRRARSIMAAFREEQAKGKNRSQAAADAASTMAGKDGHLSERIERFLRETGDPALEPERIEQEIDTLLDDPKVGWRMLRDHLQELDRHSLIAVASRASGRQPEEVEGKIEDYQQRIEALRQRLSARGEEGRSRVEEKLMHRMEELEARDPRMAGLDQDILTLFDDPKAGIEQLVHRLGQLDRESIRAIIATQTRWSDEDVDRLADRLERGRHAVMEKAHQARDEVMRRKQQAEDLALHTAEEARETVATATWWSLAAAVVAMITAGLGGWIALLT